MATPYRSRPEPPYYAVIIATTLTGEDPAGYAEMGRRMAELGSTQPGYLGRESIVVSDGSDLTVLYYADAASIEAWWYGRYRIEVARVERTYAFDRDSELS